MCLGEYKINMIKQLSDLNLLQRKAINITIYKCKTYLVQILRLQYKMHLCVWSFITDDHEF